MYRRFVTLAAFAVLVLALVPVDPALASGPKVKIGGGGPEPEASGPKVKIGGGSFYEPPVFPICTGPKLAIGGGPVPWIDVLLPWNSGPKVMIGGGPVAYTDDYRPSPGDPDAGDR